MKRIISHYGTWKTFGSSIVDQAIQLLYCFRSDIIELNKIECHLPAAGAYPASTFLGERKNSVGGRAGSGQPSRASPLLLLLLLLLLLRSSLLVCGLVLTRVYTLSRAVYLSW